MKSRRQDTKQESEDRIKDANHKLRAENRRLRKKVASLQKENNKLQNCQVLHDWDEEEPLLPPPKLQEPEEEPIDKCPKCKEELTLVPAGIFLIRICGACGFKNRKKLDMKSS